MKLTESKIKQIIREEIKLMEMDLDPTTMMMGAGAVAGLYGLYKMIFGSNASNEEEAVQRIRDHVAKLEAQVEVGDKKSPFQPPPQGDFQKIKAKEKLAQLKAQRAQNQG